MAKSEENEVISIVIEHLKWTVENKKKWNQPVYGAADYLLDAFTKQMQTVYEAGWENGLEEAHKISNDTQEWFIRNMRDYAKKHPKTTLEAYLKKNYPQ